jgi:hypothetical protein
MRKAAISAALLAFLAGIAASSGLLLPDCCTPSCDSCPIVYWKSSPATASPKVDTGVAILPAAVVPVILPRAASPAAHPSQIPSFLAHEFHRPMRN